MAAQQQAGFGKTAFEYLLNTVTAHSGLYFYAGSDTFPKFNQNVNWAIFSRPRPISEYQMSFLMKQLVTPIKAEDKLSTAKKAALLKGTNRQM